MSSTWYRPEVEWGTYQESLSNSWFDKTPSFAIEMDLYHIYFFVILTELHWCFDLPRVVHNNYSTKQHFCSVLPCMAIKARYKQQNLITLRTQKQTKEY